MDNELLQELKDAGYPFPKPINGDDFWWEPTLEELIEACGEKFWQLTNHMGSPAVWGAVSEGKEFYIKGKIPKEAVARLWLSINKKS